MKREAASQAKIISAQKITTASVITQEDSDSQSQDEEDSCNDDDWDTSVSSLKSPDLHSSSIKYSTRSYILSPATPRKDMYSKETQTEFTTTDYPVRIPSLKGKDSTLVEPRYLEAMSLLMADNLSAPEAIKAVCTVDVWKQTRHLPLELDKAYTNAQAKVKN